MSSSEEEEESDLSVEDDVDASSSESESEDEFDEEQFKGQLARIAANDLSVEDDVDASSSESESEDEFDEEQFKGKLARIAANDPTLTFVDFNGWGIGDEGAGRLVVALEGNTVVTHVWLADNGINDALASAVVDAIANSTTLIELDLEGNILGVEGARTVARLLHNNSSLARLSLQNCGIGVEGARVLAAALPHNSSLEVLNLEENSISDVGARLLMKALLVNSSVTALSLWGGDLSEALRRRVDELGRINRAATNPQEALELKIQWLRNLDEGGLGLLEIEGRGLEEEILRLGIVCRVGWLIESGVDGEKVQAVTLVLDGLEHFPQADQRRGLFQRLLGSPGHGKEVAESVNETTARSLYRYAAECGAARGVLTNLLRAHESLCTCRDVTHKLYPFMLLASLSEAGVGDVMEVLKMDPTIVRSGICQNVAKNKRKRGSSLG